MLGAWECESMSLQMNNNSCVLPTPRKLCELSALHCWVNPVFQGVSDTVLSELSGISIGWMHFRVCDIEMGEKLKVKINTCSFAISMICLPSLMAGTSPRGFYVYFLTWSYSCMLDGVLRRRSTKEEQRSSKRPRLETRSAGRATLQ